MVSGFFLGRNTREKKRNDNLVKQVVSEPSEAGKPQTSKNQTLMGKSESPDKGTATQEVTRHFHQDREHQQRQSLLKLKQYEKVKLSANQRESFKKTFLSIATRADMTWVMQRQALRNLYLQGFTLSEKEENLLLKASDQRALHTFKISDQELLKQAFGSL